MTETPKAERVLRLIRLLRERKRTVAQLAHLLDTTVRTLYRDLEALQNVGYQLHRDDHDRYSLEENPTASRTQFSLEETRLMREYLSALPATHPLRGSINRKL